MNPLSNDQELIIKYYIKFAFDRYEYNKILVIDKSYPGLISSSLTRDTLRELLITIVFRAKDPIIDFILCPIVIKNNKLIQGLNILPNYTFNLNKNIISEVIKT